MSEATAKGIMLCVRPAEMHGASELPFIPSSATQKLDPPGLTPFRKEFPTTHDYKPMGAVEKHRRKLRELEADNREARALNQAAAAAASATAASVQEFNAKLRATILAGGGATIDSFWAPAAHAATMKQQLENSQSGGHSSGGGGSGAGLKPRNDRGDRGAGVDAAGSRMQVDVEDFVNSVVQEAAGRISKAEEESRAMGVTFAPTPAPSPPPFLPAEAVSRPVSTSSASTAVKKKAKDSKPAWALSEGDVEGMMAAEEAELLNFADGLDFDGFISQMDDDPLLQASFQDVQASSENGPTGAPVDSPLWRRNMVRAMNHAAMKRVQQHQQAEAAAGARACGDDDDNVSMGGRSEAGDSGVSRGSLNSLARNAMAAAARHAAGDDGNGWEGSSRGGDDVARMHRMTSRQREAEEFLRENPELRSVHSPASVRTMLHRTEAKSSLEVQ